MNATIVLVEPKDSINIGSVARAMENFGFSKLVLVAPREFSRSLALRSACWAEKILEEMVVYQTLAEALIDCHRVIAFSSRVSGKNISHSVSLGNFLAAEKQSGNTDRIALMFGPEDSGLTNDHLLTATDLVHIESCEQNPSLNLSHAVAVVLYSLRTLYGVNVAIEAPNEILNEDQLAKITEIAALERLIQESCEASGFYNSHTPAEIPGLVNQFFRRGRISQREVRVLQGIFGAALRRVRTGP